MIRGIREDGSGLTFLSGLRDNACTYTHLKVLAFYIHKTAPLMKTPKLGLKHLVIGKFQLSISHIYTTGPRSCDETILY